MKFFNNEMYKLVMILTLQNMKALTPKELFYLTYCHSKFCFEKVAEIERNKNLYYKRATKNVTKLNDEFYSMTFPRILETLEEFEPNDLVSVLFSSTKPGLKKRELKRQLFSIGLESMAMIATLVRGIEATGRDKDEARELRSNYYEIYRVTKTALLPNKEEMKK